jgi:hypothetical protein
VVVPKIADPAQATQLARAITADIKLYNEQEIANGEDISATLDEGRQLFASRVEPALHPILEDVLRELALPPHTSGATPSGDVTQPAGSGGLPPGLFMESPRRRQRNPALPLLLLLLIGGVGAGAWWYLQNG